MGAYFRLNYRHEPTSKWPALKAKFFNFLINHHSEWKSIRNNDPLRYLPYMEAQFERVTGYKLVGLGACKEWIRAGTYYHWVIAQRGELGRCPRLAGTPLPEGPMMPPSYPPVTAVASPATATPAAPAAPPATAVTSTQATAPKPPQGGGGRPRSKSQPRKRTPLLQVSKALPGIREVLGTPLTGVAEQRLESPVRPGVTRRSVAGPVQEEGFAADGSVPPPGSRRPTSGPPSVI